MKLTRLFALACACLLSAALACTTQNGGGGGNTAGGGAAGGAGGGAKRLAFVTNNASDFWTIARKGVEKADAELDNVTAEFKIPSDGTAAEQKRIVDDLLAKGVDGIAISPVDPDNQTQLINDVAKQTLVFTQDSDAPKSDRACYVGTDNVAAGRQAGRLIKEALPKGGKVVIFTFRFDERAVLERLQGIQEELRDTNVEIIVRTDNSDLIRTKLNVADTLIKYPDVAGLVGLGATTARPS
ncbi:MAG TPA: substrate-binding domain-containing protein [Pyrinomonadaceae bacterium]